MKNIYILITTTILFFLLSFGLFFPTNVYLDIAMVLLYLLLVSRTVLKLNTPSKQLEDTHTLLEHKTAYFTPMILVPFLGLTYQFGFIAFIINILVIVLLYIYVYILTKRNRIIVTKDGISVVYLNNKTDSMLFSEVEKVEFNWVYNYIGLLDSKGKKLILDITFNDYLIIINALKENLANKLIIVAFKKLSTYYKMFLLQSNNIYLK